MIAPIETMPLAIAQRRDELRRNLDKLTRFLATDIPASERALARRHYESLRREARDIGLEKPAG